MGVGTVLCGVTDEENERRNPQSMWVCVCMWMCQTSRGYALVFINVDWKLRWKETLKNKDCLKLSFKLTFCSKDLISDTVLTCPFAHFSTLWVKGSGKETCLGWLLMWYWRVNVIRRPDVRN